MADKLTTLQSRLARLLKTRDALSAAIEPLVEEIAQTMREIDAAREPTHAPNWDKLERDPLPASLSKARREGEGVGPEWDDPEGVDND